MLYFRNSQSLHASFHLQDDHNGNEMTNNAVVRPYRSGDEDDVNRLFNRVFGLDRSLDQMRWEFMNGPVSMPEGSIVVEDKGRIVGFFGSLFQRIQVGNRILRTAYGVDNAIELPYRGGFRGLQYQMWEKQKELWRSQDIPFALGFPSREAYVVGKRLLKYRKLMDLAVLHQRLSPRLYIKVRLKRMPAFLENALLTISQVWMHILCVRFPSPPHLSIQETGDFPVAMGAFWERFRKQYPVMLVRDRDYLNWRYASHWGRSYKKWLAWSDGKVTGMAVGGIHQRGEERLGLVLELAVLPPFDAFGPLLKHVLLWFSNQKADAAIARMSPADTLLKKFQGSGFRLRQDRFDHRFAYRPLLSEFSGLSLLTDPGSWHTTLGDSDAL
jgi:hypothetical protein